jgi:hypothetical protein
MAQKLAHELRAAQQRISELEAEVVAYQNQAGRAEQWLHKVYTEIEDRFLRQERSGAEPGCSARRAHAVRRQFPRPSQSNIQGRDSPPTAWTLYDPAALARA